MVHLHPAHRILRVIYACCGATLMLIVFLTSFSGQFTNLMKERKITARLEAESATISSNLPVFGNWSLSHSRTLVVASTADQDTEWVNTELGDDPSLATRIYVVDNTSSRYSVPVNKGHEAMVYLTHVINEYEDLSDITLFVHAHQFAWHNNDLQNRDTAEMVRYLSSDYVIRNGYVNLRCHHDPGCPPHIFPYETSFNAEHPETAVIGLAWSELFPDDQIPTSLAQPCCAQVAVTRQIIQAVPRQRYVELRGWLIDTELDDGLSGRVFEYIWQYIWGQGYQYCPSQHLCYCDGYGICFGGEEQYSSYDRFKNIAVEIGSVLGTSGPAADSSTATSQAREVLSKVKSDIETQLAIWTSLAHARGKELRNRAFEAGRPWTLVGDA
jgi:hypothetical protein